MNDTLIGLYRPKKRYKRCERNTTNERPSSARVLSTPQYHPSSLTLQRGINLPQSPARPPVNMRNSTLSTAALIAPAKDGREYKIADTLRSNPRQYKNRPFSGRLYMPLQKREFYSFLRCFLAAFWACLAALARSREPVVALTVTSNLSR